jgi:1-acyl-sn-glycerol-3-phosphate acyltransferase
MLLLRNLAYYAVFYAGSVLVTLAAFLTSRLDPRIFRACVHAWSGLQRWSVEHLLGQKVIIEGAPRAEPAIYAIKHESFFEAIDAPTLFDLPVVLAKAELFRIPGWGKAALAYGLIPVDRDAGAKALMAMMRQAKAAAAAVSAPSNSTSTKLALLGRARRP